MSPDTTYRTASLFKRGLLLALVIALALLLVSLEPIALLQAYVGQHYALSAFIYFLMMFIATVIAPVAVFPLIPSIAVVLGPLTTALLSVAGWVVGAVVAFLVARRLGRPVVERFVSFETLEKYERMIPPRVEFWWIVGLRVVVPLDVFSYLLGFVSRISLARYTAATVIGVIPASFLLSYLGPAFFERNYALMAGIALAGLAAMTLSWWALKRAQHYAR